MEKIDVPGWWLDATNGQQNAFLRKTGVDSPEDFKAVLCDEKKFVLVNSKTEKGEEKKSSAISIPTFVVHDPSRLISGKNLSQQVKELCTIAGKGNVVHPWQVCDVLGMNVPEGLPLITTPLEIIKKLAESEQSGFFSWRAGKLLPKTRRPKLTPMSMEKLWQKTTLLYQQGDLGKVLYAASQSDCWYRAEQFFTALDSKGKVVADFLPRPVWAWVTKSPVSGTKGKKHPHQTELLTGFLQTLLGGVPVKLIPAFQEWAERKDGLYQLTNRNSQKAAKQLSVLLINPYLRRNPAEMLWDTTLIRLVHDVRLLESEYDRSPALSSSGGLVSFGRCFASGGGVSLWTPDAVYGHTGACLSAGLENLAP